MTTPTLSERELQSLRNMGNEAEAAAAEIDRLRADRARLVEVMIEDRDALRDECQRLRDECARLRALLHAIADKRHTYGWGPEADAAIDEARVVAMKGQP